MGDDKDRPRKLAGKVSRNRLQRIEAAGRAADDDPVAPVPIAGVAPARLGNDVNHSPFLTLACSPLLNKNGGHRFLGIAGLAEAALPFRASKDDYFCSSRRWSRASCSVSFRVASTSFDWPKRAAYLLLSDSLATSASCRSIRTSASATCRRACDTGS